MIVISDTTPLNYLVLIELESALPKLFEQVLIPPAVLNELRHIRAPDVVRNWAMQPPDWLTIRPPQEVRSLGLDGGETEAISLALEVHAGLVLIDELDARRVATDLGLEVRGTLAVIGMAAEAGLVDAAIAVDRLEATSFRAPPSLLQRTREHRRRPPR